MSGADKKYTVTFRLTAFRDNGPSRSPDCLEMPIYTWQCLDIPRSRFAEALGLMLTMMQSSEGKAMSDEILHNLGRATDVDNLLLKDIERIERNR